MIMAQLIPPRAPQWLICGMNASDGVLLLTSDRVTHCEYQVRQYLSGVADAEVVASMNVTGLMSTHGKDYPEAFYNFLGDRAAAAMPVWEGPHWVGRAPEPRDGLGDLDEYEIAVIRQLRARRATLSG